MTTRVTVTNEEVGHPPNEIHVSRAAGDYETGLYILRPGQSISTHVWEGATIIIREAKN